MQLPQLTHDDIRCRCTDQSFTRGMEYFHAGAVSNPVLHGYTLSATCRGSSTEPYRVCVELMPTGVIRVSCSCPYSGEGDCKHIVALLLIYVDAPDGVSLVENLLATLAARPKSRLLRVISEMLKRAPDFTPIARVYADIPVSFQRPEYPELVEVYCERIDRIFGIGFLEQYQLRNVLIQLESLWRHARTLAQQGETELALSMLHALIRQSIARYPDTLQQGKLPQFVNLCAKTFMQVTRKAEDSLPTLEHCPSLLNLSFDAERVFTPILTRLLEKICSAQQGMDLQVVIERRLDESADRRAHVRLLLALYLQSDRTEDYLNLAGSEGEGYRLIHHLFTLRRDAAAWQALTEFSLSADEYWHLLRSRTARRAPKFRDRLLNLLGRRQTDTAITLYQRLIEQTVLSRKREDYEKAQVYLNQLRTLYERRRRDDQWSVYLTHFRERHARKRLLLEIITEAH